MSTGGTRGGAVGWGTALQDGRSRVQLRNVSKSGNFNRLEPSGRIQGLLYLYHHPKQSFAYCHKYSAWPEGSVCYIVRWYPQLPQTCKVLIIICGINWTVSREHYIGFVSWLNELEGLWRVKRGRMWKKAVLVRCKALSERLLKRTDVKLRTPPPLPPAA